jgi:hypothetical protein
VNTPGAGSPDPWLRANDLFHRALEVPREDRDQFLIRECAGDEALRGEVSALLNAHARAGTLFDQTASGRDVGMAGLPPASDSLLGQQIAHYRFERLIGAGGMGVVYLARDHKLGRLVAIKAIAPAFTHDPSRRERLRREARAAAALTHPGIATVYAFEEIDNHVFIVGEYVAGETLREEIARGPLSTNQTIETGVGIASALAAAHDRGIVHRDLKPENIIRTPSGQVKILDFGLARLVEAGQEQKSLTEDGSVLGTPAYMAPEQIRHDTVDGRADVFALGAVLYELATGSQPFSGRDAASTIARVLELDPPGFAEGDWPPSDRPVRVALDSIVRTCLRKSPDARFATAHDVVSALERARAGRTDSVPLSLATFGVALRWWKFHQVATCLAYAALMFPLWMARTTIVASSGRYLFLTALAAAVASVVLRLHLWFTASSLPAEWKRQHRATLPWLRLADSGMVAACLISGAMTADSNPALAAILLCASVAILLSFTLIETATTRAAFGS